MKKNPITGDNLIHFAVRGKNPYCLADIFNSVNIEHDLIKEMISINPEERPNAVDILNRNIDNM